MQICDGFRVDGRWKHRRVRREEQTCELHRACMLSLDPHPPSADVLFSWLTLRMVWRTCMAFAWYTGI